MILYIIFENVLCNYNNKFPDKSTPILRNINKIKKYSNNNYTITIWSSHKNILFIIKFCELWGIKYDKISICKPEFDLLIGRHNINHINNII